MNTATIMLILRLIDLTVAGVKLTGELRESYTTLSGKIKDMVRENRTPTDEEFAELMEESRDLTDRLREAAEDPLRPQD